MTTQERIALIAEHFTKGKEHYLKCADSIVEGIDEDPEFKQKLVEANVGGLTANVIDQFERVGRRQIHVDLAFSLDRCIGYSRLITCTYSDQEYYLKNPMDVLILKDDGETDVLKVRVENLTRFQVRQMFKSGHVNDLAAQRAFLEAEKAAKAAPDGPPYIRTGNVVKVVRPHDFTRKEWKAITKEFLTEDQIRSLLPPDEAAPAAAAG